MPADDPNVFEIHRVEQHWLPTCGCPDCRAERARREPKQVIPAGPLFVMSPEAAYLFGFLPRRSPGGSLARSLMDAGS